MVVGQALLEIRDARLYRETHGSFEAYLDERWGVSRSRGYQLIDAARVTKALSTGVDLDPPANEAQARALVPLAGDEQAMVEAWRDLRAHHDGRVTADLVRQAVSERMAREAFCREPITASEPLLPETPSEVSPPSEAGGLYELGDHRLLCGDATSTTDVSRLMGGKRASLLFTSPPYLDVRLFGEGRDLSVDYLARFLPIFAGHAELIVVNLGLVRRGNAVVRYWDTYIKAAGRGWALSPRLEHLGQRRERRSTTRTRRLLLTAARVVTRLWQGAQAPLSHRAECERRKAHYDHPPTGRRGPCERASR